MFRSKILGGNDPLVDVHAMVGDVAHADVLVGGSNGNVIDVAGFVGLCGTDVDAHIAVGDGVGVDADVGLDGALINAAASIDPSVSAHVGLDALGDCGCGDTGTSIGAGVDVDADVSIPDIGLSNPLSLSSFDLSGIDLFCGDHA